jgi:3-hydroxyisobutyrate dehydrogenase-like beta-hydroxyacid dehydrogenase
MREYHRQTRKARGRWKSHGSEPESWAPQCRGAFSPQVIPFGSSIAPEKARALAADGAIVATDAAACVDGAEVAFIMVPDTPDIDITVAKIEPALRAGRLAINTSTIAPAAERAVAARLKLRGVDYLDAPVSGGDVGGRDVTLAIMIGGDAAAFERARPLCST